LPPISSPAFLSDLASRVRARAQSSNAARLNPSFFRERGAVIIIMSDRRRLVYSMLQFCNKELQSPDLSEDAKESLEVITTVFEILFNLNFYQVVLVKG
jgi:hypothetical protein